VTACRCSQAALDTAQLVAAGGAGVREALRCQQGLVRAHAAPRQVPPRPSGLASAPASCLWTTLHTLALSEPVCHHPLGHGDCLCPANNDAQSCWTYKHLGGQVLQHGCPAKHAPAAVLTGVSPAAGAAAVAAHAGGGRGRSGCRGARPRLATASGVRHRRGAAAVRARATAGTRPARCLPLCLLPACANEEVQDWLSSSATSASPSRVRFNTVCSARRTATSAGKLPSLPSYRPRCCTFHRHPGWR